MSDQKPWDCCFLVVSSCWRLSWPWRWRQTFGRRAKRQRKMRRRRQLWSWWLMQLGRASQK